MIELEIELPYPPSVNNYKRVGRTVMTKTGKSYQQRVNTNKNLKAIKRIPMPIEDEISLEVYLHPPDKRKRDIDNPCKPLIDSLVKGGLLKDDVQISRLTIERCAIIDGGKVILRIQDL